MYLHRHARVCTKTLLGARMYAEHTRISAGNATVYIQTGIVSV